MATLIERRKADRIRQKRWKEKQTNQGKKSVSAMISLKAQIILNRIKKQTGECNSAVIERAILNLADKQSK